VAVQWGKLQLTLLITWVCTYMHQGICLACHLSESKGGRLLGSGAATSFSTAIGQQGQPPMIPVAKHPCTISALRL